MLLLGEILFLSWGFLFLAIIIINMLLLASLSHQLVSVSDNNSPQVSETDLSILADLDMLDSSSDFEFLKSFFRIFGNYN